MFGLACLWSWTGLGWTGRMDGYGPTTNRFYLFALGTGRLLLDLGFSLAGEALGVSGAVGYFWLDAVVLIGRDETDAPWW